MLLSILIPCYNSEKTIKKIVELIKQEFIETKDYDYEIILVNDCSKDNTFTVIKEIVAENKNVKAIDLAKNFGQHNALIAAMNYVSGELVIGMDDDMQTHPSQIFKLINKLNEGYDVVYAKYPKKKQSIFRNLGSNFNKYTSGKLMGRPKDIVTSSFWCARRFVVCEAIRYKNFNAHIPGIFLRTTNNIANVEVEHFKREVGSSNYTLKKLFKLWAGCLNFTILPLRLSLIVGLLSAVVGFCGTIYVIIKKLFFSTYVFGWSSIVCILFVFFGLILLSLGIIGEYVGRILLSINSAPQYVIRESLNIDELNKSEGLKSKL